VTAAYIGLGSNQDEPRAQLARAFDEIAALPETRLRARSPLYRTAPVDAPDQPDFVNAVAAIDTRLPPPRLLAELQAIEASHGRRRAYRNAPRTLDLDLLLYGDELIEEPDLTVPHPRMHLRAFVLRPLLDLEPQACVPGQGRASDLLHACAGQPVERLG
jgi:2-amino-4-hydroxy-6-hydroxymethyldihydropteridine diphosphokinase